MGNNSAPPSVSARALATSCTRAMRHASRQRRTLAPLLSTHWSIVKLSRFITDHLEQILKEWELFASSLPIPGADISKAELRDHAKQMLETIVRDMDVIENAAQRKKKSITGVSEITGKETAAATHGFLRQQIGFTLPQLTAEFRAMRASVLRLWMAQVSVASKTATEDILRFNEAIDKALQESAIRYSQQSDRTRNTFLAILSHDLRSPLSTMTMAGALLSRPSANSSSTVEIGARVARSAATMTTMVNDLLEFARTQLGGHMPISSSLGDLGEICKTAVEDASAAHPKCKFELSTKGEMIGDFDAPRLAQLFSNLLNNAAQYRTDDQPVTITACGDDDTAVVQVKNFGRQIPEASLKTIFDPLVQLAVSDEHKAPNATSIGLGLFIAREIACAHGGTIGAESSLERGTVFTVRLPRVSLNEGANGG
ncbi:ATP-binding protein [Janthinobacterium sp. MDB2-8]|uniref:ATP-binding protein n=1 Tax=Janthinobacterium sp. MDB2-8 TaxID=1259338 RepID=UPI003F23009D